MSALLAPVPVAKFWDNNGLPLFKGKLATYAAGTTTPQATYIDSTQTTPNTNPVILNARGECNLWLDPTLTYKFVLTDVLGSVISTVDNIPGGFSPSAIAASLIPKPTNTWTLGSSSFTWANLYLGASGIPLLDPTTGNILFYARTPAEIAAGVTPVNYAYAPNDVRRMGVVGDGATDDTAAVQNAYLVGGEWKLFPGAKVRITSTITGVKATRLYSETAGPMGTSGAPPGTQAFLIHDFNGTFFDLVGLVSNDQVGAGFTWERITFIQKDGNASGASGICIRCVVVPGTTVRCPWIKVRDCNFEQYSGAVNDWTWAVYLDGTAVASPNNMRDCQFSGIRIASGAHASGSMYISGLANVFLNAVECNLANGNIELTGVSTCIASGIFLTGCTVNNFIMDWVLGVYGGGNSAATVTTTTNSATVALDCSCTGTAPTISGTDVTVVGVTTTGKWSVSTSNNTRFEMGANTAEHSGPVASDVALQAGTNPATAGAVRIPNAANLAARNAANSGNINMLGVDASNRVQLSPDGQPILWVPAKVALGAGATATLGTIGGSGPATAAQAEWIPIVDSAGNACWFPVWR